MKWPKRQYVAAISVFALCACYAWKKNADEQRLAQTYEMQFGIMQMLSADIEKLMSSVTPVRHIHHATQYVNSTTQYVNNAVFLYSKQHSGHIVMDTLKDELLAPLTRWTQMEIFKHQNPHDCKKPKFLLTNGYNSGFGSEMHVIGTHLAHAIQNDYVLMWGSQSCKRFAPSGCESLFKDLSNCSHDSSFDTNKWGAIDSNIFHDVVPDLFKNAMQAKLPSLTDNELRYWWRAQSVAYLMRLNENTITELSKMRHDDNFHYMSKGNVPFPLPSGTVNAHIRHGDKGTEMKLVPSVMYVRAFKSMIANSPNSFSRILFVSSDDQEAVNTCRRLVEGDGMTYINTKLDRMDGGHFMNKWDKDKNNLDRTLILGHLLQLLMALEADAWIGTRGSNWNRLIDELRCVWVDKCHYSYVEVATDLAPGSYDW